MRSYIAATFRASRVTHHAARLLALAVLPALLATGCTAKYKATHHLNRADRYFAAGQYDRAEIEYKNVLRYNRQNPRAWGRLGIIYFDDGRFLAAAPMLLRAQQLDTNYSDVRLKLAAIDLAGAKWSEARDQALAVLAHDPKNAEAPVLLAQTAITPPEIQAIRARLQKLAPAGNPAAFHVALGFLALRAKDLKTAADEFKQALALDPKSSDAHWAMGDVYLAVKNMKQADAEYQTAASLAPPRSGKKLQYAEFKIATGDIPAARRIMQELAQAMPDYLPAQVGLASIAANEQKYDEAAALLAKVLARDPSDFDALLLDGQVKIWQRQTAQAIAELERTTKEFPRAPTAYFQLAIAYYANNDFKDATARLQQALQLNPYYVDASLLLGQIQIKQGNLPQAIAGLTRLMQREPQVLQTRLLLADAYRLQGDVAAAVQLYQDLVAVNPQNAEVHMLLGGAYLEQKQDTQARDEFDKALALVPTFLPPFEQLVNLDIKEKQFDAAWQRVAHQLPQTNFPPAALQLLLAKIAAARGDTAQEQTNLQKAIALRPDLPTGYLLLAQLYVDGRQDKKALAQVQAGLDKDPQNVSLLMLRGMIYNAETNYPAAADAYRQLLAIDPNFVVALNNLAYLDAQSFGRLDDAEQLARQARALQPTDPAIADTLGWILSLKKQYSSALALLQESAVRLSDEPEVQFHLGKTSYLMGDEAAARTALQRAVQLGKDFPDQAECRQCLAVLAVDPHAAGPEARTILKNRVAAHPDDLIACFRLAAVYQAAGEAGKAEEAYQAVVQADPQNFSALIQLARLYADRDTSKALDFARDAYKLAPDNPDVAQTLAHLAFRTGDFQWSYRLLQPFFRNESANADTLYEFGMAAYNVGRISDATSAMQILSQAAPASARAPEVRQMLELLNLAAHPAQAVAQAGYVQNILNSNPDYIPALMVEGAINEQKSDAAAAEHAYERVLGLNANFAPAQARLAILYSADPARDRQTSDLATKALQVFPDDPALARVLGIVAYRTASSADDYGRAAALLAASVRSQPPDAQSLYYLGMAQYQVKQTAESKNNLQRALALHLPDQLAAEAKHVLAGLK